MNPSRQLPVPDGVVGERADVGLARMLGLSRTKAQALLHDGNVILDGTVVGKSDILSAGIVDVTIPAEEPAAAEPALDGGLPVAYEDDDIAVIDKPVGVAAHPSPGWNGATVTGALRSQGMTLAASGAAERQGIVHRLDVGTSGLMVVAKSANAYSTLKRAFKEREVDKTYHALAQGHLDPTEGTIDAPIGRHPSHDYRFAVTAEGRPSITHYATLEMMPSASLLEIRLETGRTHQIRVHCAALRHPLVGDTTYGADPTLAASLGLERQWLHAVALGFAHPISGTRVVVESAYPADLTEALDRLRL